MQRLQILYEDRYILVVNKPEHLLTVSTTKEKYNTLYHQVYTYIKKVNPKVKVFIVHRLDRDTSGVIVFAKLEKAKEYLQKHWDKYDREYLALCKGKMDRFGVIKNYLKENSEHMVYITEESPDAKFAETEYEVLQPGYYNLVRINIKTGRKNQIRVHMKSINAPVVGDKKYALDKVNKHLYLHAYKLTIVHPITRREMTFIAPLPTYFSKYVRMTDDLKFAEGFYEG